jgi:hypothetical protein
VLQKLFRYGRNGDPDAFGHDERLQFQKARASRNHTVPGYRCFTSHTPVAQTTCAVRMNAKRLDAQQNQTEYKH